MVQSEASGFQIPAPAVAASGMILISYVPLNLGSSSLKWVLNHTSKGYREDSRVCEKYKKARKL